MYAQFLIKGRVDIWDYDHVILKKILPFLNQWQKIEVVRIIFIVQLEFVSE